MDSRTVVDESAEEFHPIRPTHIDTRNHFWNSFGHRETEISANWIVRFLQVSGNRWLPFSENTIERFYNTCGHRGFTFNQLLVGGHVVQGAGGLFRVTHSFICRCFGSSPMELRKP